MAAKFDNASNQPAEQGVTQPPAAVKPEGVPDKFWDAEKGVVNFAAWSKSTLELEQKLSGKPQTDPKAPEQITAPPANTAADALAAKGLDITEFSAEYAQNQKLSDESYAKLEAAGFGRQLVDTYMNGQRAEAERYNNEVFTAAGGQEQYSKAVEWAKAGMTKAEIEAFNAAITSGNTASAKLAVAGLMQSFTAANGHEPTLLGSTTSVPGVTGFKSRHEQNEAINKRDSRNRKLYDVDSAYRAQVEAKIMQSSF